jgi:hypothetical protein
MNSSEEYKMRFARYMKKYPLTVSLFRKTKLEEAFGEVADVMTMLGREHSGDYLKVKLGEILLNRDELRLRHWTPIHHAFYGAVFKLETYKDKEPFLLEKCERYLSFLGETFGENENGVGDLKRELRDNNNFQRGIFFEMEADVLLAKSTRPPQGLRKKLKKKSNKDVDFVGTWHGKALNFEIKSLTESPKYLAKGSEQTEIIEITWMYFEHDRRKRIKDILVDEAIPKFEPGANNFLVIPDAGLIATNREELDCVIQDLRASDLEISRTILAVIMYRTGLLNEGPENQRAIMAKVGDCRDWVQEFSKDFCSAEA